MRPGCALIDAATHLHRIAYGPRKGPGYSRSKGDAREVAESLWCGGFNRLHTFKTQRLPQLHTSLITPNLLSELSNDGVVDEKHSPCAKHVPKRQQVCRADNFRSSHTREQLREV